MVTNSGNYAIISALSREYQVVAEQLKTLIRDNRPDDVERIAALRNYLADLTKTLDLVQHRRPVQDLDEDPRPAANDLDEPI